MSETPDFDPRARERDNARAEFYVDTVKNEAESAKQGRAVFIEREMVKIIVPGDRLTEHVAIVGEQHRQRFYRQYEAFKANRDAPLVGTPIEELSGLSRAQVEELKYAKVRTVEELASLPDDLLRKVAPMGGNELRAKAQRRLEYEAGAAPMEKLAAENAQQAATIQEQEQRLAELERLVKNLSSKPTSAEA